MIKGYSKVVLHNKPISPFSDILVLQRKDSRWNLNKERKYKIRFFFCKWKILHRMYIQGLPPILFPHASTVRPRIASLSLKINPMVWKINIYIYNSKKIRSFKNVQSTINKTCYSCRVMIFRTEKIILIIELTTHMYETAEQTYIVKYFSMVSKNLHYLKLR